MRFSIFTTVHDTGDGQSPDQTLDDFREQCVLADELGYHAAPALLAACQAAAPRNSKPRSLPRTSVARS